MVVARQHFSFDDEDTRETTKGKTKKSKKAKKSTSGKPTATSAGKKSRQEFHFEDGSDKIDIKQAAAQQSRKLRIRKGRLFLVVFAVFVLAFGLYLFLATRENGPVYGDRCEGMLEITDDQKETAIKAVTDKYSDVKSCEMEIACKELKIDITFKKGTSTSYAKKVAKYAVTAVDDAVGREKSGTYSDLFGTYDGVKQYECDFYLVISDNDDSPIYGTKMASSNKFYWTLSSIKDKDSYNDSLETDEKKDDDDD